MYFLMAVHPTQLSSIQYFLIFFFILLLLPVASTLPLFSPPSWAPQSLQGTIPVRCQAAPVQPGFSQSTDQRINPYSRLTMASLASISPGSEKLNVSVQPMAKRQHDESRCPVVQSAHELERSRADGLR